MPSTVMLSQYVSSLKSTRIRVVWKFVDPQSVQAGICCQTALTGRDIDRSSSSSSSRSDRLSDGGPTIANGFHRLEQACRRNFCRRIVGESEVGTAMFGGRTLGATHVLSSGRGSRIVHNASVVVLCRLPSLRCYRDSPPVMRRRCGDAVFFCTGLCRRVGKQLGSPIAHLPPQNIS